MKLTNAHRLMTILFALALLVFGPQTRPAMAVSVPHFATGFSLTQTNQNIEGFWQGTLDTGPIKLPLVMKFSKTPEGQFKGLLDSPAQGVNDIPMNVVTFQNGALHVEMRTIGASYDGKLNAAGTELTGEFTQGSKIALNLKRIEKLSEGQPKRPQTPVKPYPYDEQEVSYENKTDKVTLAATLTLPRGNGPFPAVILITGSGAQNRDEMLLGHRPFLVLADYLTRNGIAVLRADDRGVGGTSRGAAGDTSENYVGDALAGVEFLKTRKEINPKQIGLIGHSEGGMIAPMAAIKSSDVAFIVMLAGPGIPGDKLIVMQSGLVAKAECERGSKTASEQAERLFAIAKEEKDPVVAKQKLQEERTRIAAAERNKLEAQLSLAAANTNQLASPWFRFFLNYDPRPTLSKVTVPVLALNGENDVQVPAREDLDAIDQALKAGGNRDYKVVLLPKLNHLMQTSTTGGVSEYSEIEETMAPVVLKTVSDWITAHTSAKTAR